MTYVEAVMIFGTEVVPPPPPESSPFPNWFTFGLAALAFALSVYNTWWQRREASRNRRPDLTIRTRYRAGVENREGRPSNSPPERIYIDLLSTAPTTIERVGLVPPRSHFSWSRGWRDLTTDAFTLVRARSGSPKIPSMMLPAPLPQLCDSSLEVIFQVPFPLVGGLNRSNGVRVWVETSTKQRVLSEPIQLPEPLPWPADDDSPTATA